MRSDHFAEALREAFTISPPPIVRRFRFEQRAVMSLITLPKTPNLIFWNEFDARFPSILYGILSSISVLWMRSMLPIDIDQTYFARVLFDVGKCATH